MQDFLRIHRPLYRVYHLNRTGVIERADIIDAIDDEDAIAIIGRFATDHPCELWDRARFVAKAEPPPAALIAEPLLSRRDPAPPAPGAAPDVAIPQAPSRH